MNMPQVKAFKFFRKKKKEADQAEKSVHLHSGHFYDHKEKKEVSSLGTYGMICNNLRT